MYYHTRLALCAYSPYSPGCVCTSLTLSRGCVYVFPTLSADCVHSPHSLPAVWVDTPHCLPGTCGFDPQSPCCACPFSTDLHCCVCITHIPTMLCACVCIPHTLALLFYVYVPAHFHLVHVCTFPIMLACRVYVCGFRTHSLGCVTFPTLSLTCVYISHTALCVCVHSPHSTCCVCESPCYLTAMCGSITNTTHVCMCVYISSVWPYGLHVLHSLHSP